MQIVWNELFEETLVMEKIDDWVKELTQSLSSSSFFERSSVVNTICACHMHLNNWSESKSCIGHLNFMESFGSGTVEIFANKDGRYS